MKKSYRLLLLAGIVLAAGIVGFGFYMFVHTVIRNNSISNQETSQRLYAKTLAIDIEEFFEDVEKRMEIISLFPTIKNAERSEKCNQDLQYLLEHNSAVFSNLGRVSKDGIFVCAVNRSIVGEPASKYGDYFQRAKADPEHKAVMSRLIYPTGSGEPVIAVHVPVFNDKGEFNGTIGGAVYFSEFQQHLLNDVKISPRSFVILHDENGDILYHPDPLIRGKNIASKEMMDMFTPRQVMSDFANTIKKGGSGRLQYSLRGQERVAMYERANVIGRHWTAVIAVPRQDLDKSTHDSSVQQLLIAVAILLSLSLCLLTVYVLRTHTKVNLLKW